MFIGKIETNRPIALALGAFDGIHKGHMAVISLAADNPYGLDPAVAAFVPRPREVINGAAPDYIITEEQRKEILRQIGVDLQVTFDFPAVKNLEPEEFFYQLTAELPVKMLCCGYNFRFGAGGRGDAALLETLCVQNGLHFAAAPEVKINGMVVSSSAIRECISLGDVAGAEEMLGRPLIFDLTVEDGDRRGRTIGFPTINQQLPDNMVRPKFGVYASAVFVENEWRPAVTNIGIRPTYLVPKPLFETYIIGYSGDLYGRSVQVRLKRFLRREEKFDSLEELKNAIEHDAQNVLDHPEK